MRAELRQAMKESRIPLEHSYKRCVISLLNQVFGIGNIYWKSVLIPAAKAKFEDCLSSLEEAVCDPFIISTRNWDSSSGGGTE